MVTFHPHGYKASQFIQWVSLRYTHFVLKSHLKIEGEYQTEAATVDNSMEFPLKTKNGTAFWTGISAAGNIP